MLTLGKLRHTDPHGPPPTPSISPRTAASNAVPCYRQHSGTQPGLSLSPGGSPSSKDPPPPSRTAPIGVVRPQRGLLWGGGRSQAAVPWGGGTLPTRGGHNSMGGTAPGCQAAPISPPCPPPSFSPPPPPFHGHTLLFLRAIDLFGHPGSAQRCGGER